MVYTCQYTCMDISLHEILLKAICHIHQSTLRYIQTPSLAIPYFIVSLLCALQTYMLLFVLNYSMQRTLARLGVVIQKQLDRVGG